MMLGSSILPEDDILSCVYLCCVCSPAASYTKHIKHEVELNHTDTNISAAAEEKVVGEIVDAVNGDDEKVDNTVVKKQRKSAGEQNMCATLTDATCSISFLVYEVGSHHK